MFSRILAGSIAFFAGTLLNSASPAGWALAAEPIPVRWNTGDIQNWFAYGTPVTQDIARLMQFPLHGIVNGHNYRLPVVIGEKGHEREYATDTCADALKYIPRANKRLMPSGILWTGIEEDGMQCAALLRLAKLKPAQVSYLPFATRPLVKRLAGLTLPAKDPKDAAFFHPLKRIEDVHCASDGGQDGCNVNVAGRGYYEFSVIAAGDYNGDGIEDLLIDCEFGWDKEDVPRDLMRIVGVVITQMSVDGKLQLLDWWDWHG